MHMNHSNIVVPARRGFGTAGKATGRRDRSSPAEGFAQTCRHHAGRRHLNVALGLEHEAINAYQLGAASGLLQKPVLTSRCSSEPPGHRDADRDHPQARRHAVAKPLDDMPRPSRPIR
jgi:hypothetical protein